jgi:phthalate 4,5-cis-dihydrodiol dehydrogenase
MESMTDEVRITAVADIRPEALRDFTATRPSVRTFERVEDMCASPDVDVVWVSTPNQFHASNAVCAARNGKHVVCEKPMATSVAECNEIVAAVEANGVKYVQGHSKVYQESLQTMRRVIASGELGRPTQINTWNYNDWLLRPALPAERDTASGTGPVYRQGPHQVDIIRYLAGSRATSVRAVTGRWEAGFEATESNFSALVMFEDDLAATLSFNAQGYFDASDLTWGLSEGGYRMLNADSVLPRQRRTPIATPDEKQGYLKKGDPYGRGAMGGEDRKAVRKQQFFGLTIVSCERGVVRQSPDGVYVYDAGGRREIGCSSNASRGAAELRELIAALAENRQPLLDANWGRATLEVCVAILESSRTKREIELQYQAEIAHASS